MEELFNLPPQKSPRLLWLEKNKLRVEKHPHFDNDEDEFGKEIFEYYAIHDNQLDKAVGGETEAIAIANWALQSGICLWNEEAFANKKFISAAALETRNDENVKTTSGGGGINSTDFDVMP